MSIPPDELLADFSRNGAASEESIQAAAAALGISLPSDYQALMHQTNGGEGFIGSHYLILWKIEELVQFNREYQVEDYAPGLVLFASSGGGEGFAFDTRTSPYRIVQVPFIGMSLNDSVVVAGSVENLLEKMLRSDGSLL